MKSVLKYDHPLVSFLYFIGALTLLTLEQHPIFLLMDVCLLACFILVLDRGDYLKKWGFSIFVIAIVFLVINPLVNHRGTHVLFFFGQNPIMLEAVIQGIMTAFTLMGIFLLMASYNKIVTSDRFLYLFSKFFPQWALLTLLSLRFVPLLRRRLQEIELIQKTKGLSVKEGRIKERLRAGILVVQILLTWSLEDAIQTADSMVARGYGLKKRSQYTPYNFRTKDGFLLGILAILLGLNVFGYWLGDSVLSLWPILETWVLHGREWFYFLINFIYFSWPLWREGWEGVRWQFLRRNN